MRHAKSDWDTGVADFDRPLNKRGKSVAPVMGNYLLKQNKIPNLIISSSAKRAKDTTELVQEAINYNGEVNWNSAFYHGNEDTMLDSLFSLEKNVECVLLVGHNPTVESLVTKLTSKYKTMVTATVVSIFVDIEKWEDLQLYENRLEWAMSPKNIK